jgi:hypothetical protein
MTENKRFTYLDYSRDGYIGSFYLNDKPLTNKEVWDLLNKQDIEIQRIYSTLDNRIEKLQEDLEKLKELDNTEELNPQAVEDVALILSISFNALKEFKKELTGDDME